jgi:deazaflavin-dependent oxidoreductase (nitroreductase family)
MNRVLDPWLVRQGVVSSSNGEIGLLEHVGRKSGVVRVTPVHPVRTAAGFRIVVPLGVESQWALNVIAAGHCRLQVGEVVHELDEPLLVMASGVDGLPEAATRVMDWLGFRYLVLRQFAEHEGTLETPDAPIEAPIEVPTESAAPEAVATA